MLCLCLITAYDSSEKMHIISYVDISSSSPLFIKFHSISNVHHRTVNDTNSIYFGVYNINTFHYKIKVTPLSIIFMLLWIFINEQRTLVHKLLLFSNQGYGSK